MKEKSMDEVITITKERLKELLQAEKMLGCLVAAGIDNWEGYEVALDMMDE